jgi:hypothetical protein
VKPAYPWVYFIGFLGFSSWILSHIQLYEMERLYSGRGAEQCTSLDSLTELSTLSSPKLCPYMAASWICVLWLGAVRPTCAVTSAWPDKGIENYLNPLPRTPVLTYSLAVRTK